MNTPVRLLASTPNLNLWSVLAIATAVVGVIVLIRLRRR